MTEERAEGGPEAWLSDQIGRWGDAVVRFAGLYTGSPDLAQDVAQETFLRLWAERVRRPGFEPAPGWLFTVARNVSSDLLRRRRTVPRMETSPATPTEAEAITRLAVREVLDRLPNTDRECLLLFYFADLAIAEIAAHLGITEGSVKMRLRRARDHFLERWEGNG